MKSRYLLIYLSVCVYLLSAFCSEVFAAQKFVFSDAKPVTQLEDQKPSEVPEKSSYDQYDYAITSAARYPVTDLLDFRKTPRSRDVNSLDQVPASSWYTPRLGSQEVTTEELLRGPEKVGAPQKPFRIVKAKKKGTNPGFVIEDARGHRYLIKFDTIEIGGLESGVGYIVNRLFWGFGYNVPEDYVFTFSKNDYTVDVKPEDESLIEQVFQRVQPDRSGNYRSAASLYLQGTILGPIPQKGTRKGDSNDLIPHENLRILRALYLFCAWTQNTGMRIDNSLDVYEGNPGEGYTKHYLLDFGEALGAHGFGKGWKWDGYEFGFSFSDIVTNYFKFGKTKKWETMEGDESDPRSFFDVRTFEPDQWKEILQYVPIRSSLPDDHYWAAKIIEEVTPEQVEALFNAAAFTDEMLSRDLQQALLKRQERVVRYAYSSVTPLEMKAFSNNRLSLEDRGFEYRDQAVDYEIEFFDRGAKKLHEMRIKGNSEMQWTLPSAVLNSQVDYLRIEISIINNPHKAEPVEFHFRRNVEGDFFLVGVIH